MPQPQTSKVGITQLMGYVVASRKFAPDKNIFVVYVHAWCSKPIHVCLQHRHHNGYRLLSYLRHPVFPTGIYIITSYFEQYTHV